MRGAIAHPDRSRWQDALGSAEVPHDGSDPLGQALADCRRAWNRAGLRASPDDLGPGQSDDRREQRGQQDQQSAPSLAHTATLVDPKARTSTPARLN